MPFSLDRGHQSPPLNNPRQESPNKKPETQDPKPETPERVVVCMGARIPAMAKEGVLRRLRAESLVWVDAHTAALRVFRFRILAPCRGGGLQGYLAHKKTPAPLGPP